GTGAGRYRVGRPVPHAPGRVRLHLDVVHLDRGYVDRPAQRRVHVHLDVLLDGRVVADRQPLLGEQPPRVPPPEPRRPGRVGTRLGRLQLDPDLVAVLDR